MQRVCDKCAWQEPTEAGVCELWRVLVLRRRVGDGVVCLRESYIHFLCSVSHPLRTPKLAPARHATLQRGTAAPHRFLISPRSTLAGRPLFS